MGKKACAQCKKEFQPGESILTAMNKPWHVGCFVCAKCKKPFTGGSIALGENGKPMHEDCAKEQFDKDNGTCDACGKSLGTSEPIVELSDYSQFHQSCFKCAVCDKPFDTKSPYHVKVNGKPCHSKCADVADDVVEKVSKDNQCAGCGKPMAGAVKVIPDVGSYHPECFVCDTCGCELSGSYALHPKTEKPNCKKCVKNFVKKWDRNKEDNAAKKSGKACMKCAKPIEAGTAKIIPDVGSYHPECFVCDTCGDELNDEFFPHPKTKMPHCKPCLDKFMEDYNSKQDCVKCGKKINPGDEVNIPDIGIMHSECFVCNTCRDVITGLKNRGKYSPHPETGLATCKDCMKMYNKRHGGVYEEEDKGETKKKEKKPQAKKTVVNEGDCVKCGKAVDPDDAKEVDGVGSFHRECFQCDTCGCTINRKYKVHPETNMPNCRPCMEKYENE